MSNKAKIDKILSKTEQVEVLGETFTLTMPTSDKLAELRKLQLSAAKFSEDQLRGEEGLEYLANYTTQCVALVLDVDEQDASGILFATGGEGGEFFKTIQQFLGMIAVEDDGSVDEAF